MALQMSKLKNDVALLQTVRDLRVALQPLAFIRDVCPLTFVLLDLIVSAPTTSVSGERGFSEMKLYLSRLRSSLQEVQLHSSMFINNHAPSWSDDPEGIKRFLDASIERFLNSDTKRRVLSSRYSKFPKDPVKHIRTAKQTTMNSCFSQDSMKRQREVLDAETDSSSEVDEEAAEEGTAYEEPREAGNVDETRDEKQAKKMKKSKKSKKLTTKKAKKTKQKNREETRTICKSRRRNLPLKRTKTPRCLLPRLSL
jgi:hypothetical protein